MTEKRFHQRSDNVLSHVFVCCIVLGSGVCSAQHADVLVDVVDQQLVVNENLFLADFRGGLQSSDESLELSNPGYATQAANRLLAGTLLSFDVIGPLLFFDGTAWEPAAAGHDFRLFRPLIEDHSAIVTGQSESQNGFLLAQADDQGMIHEHIRFRLETETDVPPEQGVYAIQQVLTSPTYDDSDPFLLVFNNGLESSSFVASVVAARQLIADSVFDCSGDGLLTADDLTCVSEITQRDNVLRAIASVAGDLDGNQAVNFTDFLILSQSFGTDATSYKSGNVDLSDGVDFADFLILSGNFGFDSGSTLATVPESDGSLVHLVALSCLPALRWWAGRLKHKDIKCQITIFNSDKHRVMCTAPHGLTSRDLLRP